MVDISKALEKVDRTGDNTIGTDNNYSSKLLADTYSCSAGTKNGAEPLTLDSLLKEKIQIDEPIFKLPGQEIPKEAPEQKQKKQPVKPASDTVPDTIPDKPVQGDSRSHTAAEEQEVKEPGPQESAAFMNYEAGKSLGKQWSLLDENGDDEIDKDELAKAVKDWGNSEQGRQFAHVLKHFDTIKNLNQDNFFSSDSAIARRDLDYYTDISRERSMDAFYHQDATAFLKANFNELDRGKDGKIDQDELKLAGQSDKFKADKNLITYLESRMTGDYSAIDGEPGHSHQDSKAATYELTMADTEMTLDTRMEATAREIYAQSYSHLAGYSGIAIGGTLGAIVGSIAISRIKNPSGRAQVMIFKSAISSGAYAGKVVGEGIDYWRGQNYYDSNQRDNLNSIFNPGKA